MMHPQSLKHRVALWGLGFWAMGTVAIAVVAMRNFSTIDQLLVSLPNATFREIVEGFGSRESRELLRYVASEVNRGFFEIWGWGQVPLGTLILWLVWDSGRRVRYGVMAMVGIVLILAFGLTPPIVSIGRTLDFVVRDPAPPGLATFGILHAAYSIAEFAKLGVGALVAYWLVKE